MPKKIDLTGKRFGRLIVLRESSERGAQGQIIWECECSCGKAHAVRGHNLRSGEVKSCGCLSADVTAARSTTHGLRRDAHYSLWANMRARCECETNAAYPRYGGRGIQVCERWGSFEMFLKDMGPRPSPKHSIERINNDGPYSPENCRWATHKEQARNTRRNKLIEYDGELLCEAAWSERTGISRDALRWRFSHGWSAKRALTTPSRSRRKTQARST